MTKIINDAQHADVRRILVYVSNEEQPDPKADWKLFAEHEHEPAALGSVRRALRLGYRHAQLCTVLTFSNPPDEKEAA